MGWVPAALQHPDFSSILFISTVLLVLLVDGAVVGGHQNFYILSWLTAFNADISFEKMCHKPFEILFADCRSVSGGWRSMTVTDEPAPQSQAIEHTNRLTAAREDKTGAQRNHFFSEYHGKIPA